MDNTLNLQITVTDEQMTSLLKGKLESLPDEKVQEIFSNALSEFFKTPTGQQMFYVTSYWGDSNPKPTDLLKTMVGNAVSKELLKPCVDEMIAVLKDNYPKLIQNAMIQTFSNMFFTEMRDITLQAQLGEILAKCNQKG